VLSHFAVVGNRDPALFHGDIADIADPYRQRVMERVENRMKLLSARAPTISGT
jgi:hypothetical protein